MARVNELVERTQKLRDVFKVQTRGRFVEHKELAARTLRIVRLNAFRQDGNRPSFHAFREMPGKLQALRLTARERGHRLPEPNVVEAYVGERT